jgi:hypothetical protein
MKIASYIASFLALSISLFAQAQTQSAPPPQVVEIRLNQPTPTVQVPLPQSSVASEFVKSAQDLGSAIGGGLKNLAHETKDMTFGKDKTIVQGIDDLAKTDAGKFTMAIIAWKVAGRDAIELVDRVKTVVIGVPLLIALNCVFFWFYRRNFTAYSVVKTSEGPWWNRKRTYVTVNEDSRWSDGKCGGAVVTGLAWGASTIIILSRIVFF